MAVFVINGKETDSYAEAVELIRTIWAASKKDAVAAQLDAVKNKKNDPAAARAALGVVEG